MKYDDPLHKQGYVPPDYTGHLFQTLSLMIIENSVSDNIQSWSTSKSCIKKHYESYFITPLVSIIFETIVRFSLKVGMLQSLFLLDKVFLLNMYLKWIRASSSAKSSRHTVQFLTILLYPIQIHPSEIDVTLANSDKLKMDNQVLKEQMDRLKRVITNMKDHIKSKQN